MERKAELKEALKLANAHLTRKACAWDEVGILPLSETQTEVLAKGLPLYKAEDVLKDLQDPMSAIKGGVKPQYFIMITAYGTRLLVNTEGYEYCRYIGRLPMAKTPEEIKTIQGETANTKKGLVRYYILQNEGHDAFNTNIEATGDIKNHVADLRTKLTQIRKLMPEGTWTIKIEQQWKEICPGNGLVPGSKRSKIIYQSMDIETLEIESAEYDR